MIKKFLNLFIVTGRIRGIILYPLLKLKFKSIKFPIILYPNIFLNNQNKIEFGKHISIAFGAYISPLELKVGDNTWIGNNCFLCGKVLIGNNVMIGPNVSIPGAEHRYNMDDKPMSKQGLVVKGTIIEDNVWIGANSVILDGVRIGRDSIVAAGSVVTKDVEANSIMMGIPARFKKKRVDK